MILKVFYIFFRLFPVTFYIFQEMNRPHDYESITILNILDHITELPSWVSDCKKLETLDCSYNQITHLDNLPIILEYLDCGNNPLKYYFEPTLENIRKYNNQTNQNKLPK